MKNYQIDTLKASLATANSVLLVVPQMNGDTISAALAMGLSLKKAGKSVQIYCPTTPDANYSRLLTGLDMVTTSLGSSDLTITLDYPLEQIEKVSYNDNGGKLNLVVEVKPNAPKVENNQINVAGQSSLADLCIMFGDETPLAEKAAIVNTGTWILITNRYDKAMPKSWAKSIIYDPDAPFTEIMPFLIPMAGIDLTGDACRNLLLGLRAATQNFGVNVSPETFEAGAVLLRISQTQPTQVAPQGAQMGVPVNPAQPNPTPVSAVETNPSGQTPQSNSAPTQLPTV